MTLQNVAQTGGIKGGIAAMIYIGTETRNTARALRAFICQHVNLSRELLRDSATMKDTFCGLLQPLGRRFQSTGRFLVGHDQGQLWIGCASRAKADLSPKAIQQAKAGCGTVTFAGSSG